MEQSTGEDTKHSRLGPPGAWIEGAAILAIFATLGIIAHGKLERAQAATRYTDTLSDLRYQMRAIEAYAVDNTNYLFMSWGDYVWWREDGFSDSYAGFATFGTLTNHMTTPIAYMNQLMEDPVSTQSLGHPELYTYQSVAAHRWLFYQSDGGTVPVPGNPGHVYQALNTSAQNKMELYFGAFVVWGCGPSGNVDPDTMQFWLPYDPTNGALSPGNVVLGPRAQMPISLQPL